MFVGHYGPGFVAKRPRDPIPLSGPEAGCHVGRGCVDDADGGQCRARTCDLLLVRQAL
jgi:hypothetical protein